MSSVKIDPILLSVYARTFKSITDEMSISMEQTTRSPILCEAKDYVTGLYDADGNMLEQTENLPILAFSLAPVCKYIKEYFGDEAMLGYVKGVQRAEIRQGIACVKHQNMSGSDIGDDHKEYFAELSEAYWGRNDYFPYTRQELKTYDPTGFAVLEQIWKVK